MKAIERIEQRWFRDEALQNLNVEEASRVIDALALMLYADQKATSDEEAAFDALANTLPFGWGEVGELTAHAAEAARRADSLPDDDAVLEAAASIARRVPPQVRAQVFGMVVAIAASDNELGGPEAYVLTAFATSFGFDEETAHAIYNETLDAMGLVEE